MQSAVPFDGCTPMYLRAIRMVGWAIKNGAALNPKGARPQLPLPPSSPREVRADISTMNGALSVCENRVQLINSCWLLRSYNKCVVWEARRDRRFHARLSAKGYSWLWPAIAAAHTSKHHWLVIACNNAGVMRRAIRSRKAAAPSLPCAADNVNHM
jgi:hypothetical protein